MTSIQDLGRHRGSRNRPGDGRRLDQYSAEVANALVGSARTAPLLELLAMDFSAVASTDLLVAVTGAPADVRVGGVARPQWEPFVWTAGEELTVRGIRGGLRVYLAVHGTTRRARLLGSCAPDSVLGFGRQLAVGESIAIDVDGPPVEPPHFRMPLFRLGARTAAFTGHWPST